MGPGDCLLLSRPQLRGGQLLTYALPYPRPGRIELPRVHLAPADL
jgi:hypothetical protein